MLNHAKFEKILLMILEGLIYLTFFMPFVFIGKSIFPFIVGKILYFQSVVQLMAVFYILLLAVNFNKFRPRKNWLLYWFGFYAAALLLSAIFGIDFDRAFWSNFERMTGVFVVYHFIIYAIIVSVVFDRWEKIRRALQVLLAVSLIELAVVIAQYIKPGVYLYPNKGGRIWGTLGNSIYIGSYFLFHIFFALLLAVKEKKNQLLQMAYLIIAAVETFFILYSRSSRGADIAMLFGVFAVVFGYLLFSKRKMFRTAGVAALILCCIAGGGLLIFRKSAFVKSIPVIGEVLGVSFQEGTGRTRAIAWEIGLKVFKERPIFGLGQENFYYGFNKYYNPESLLYSYYETWFDRSHSIIFDTLASGGFVGFVAYFGLFVVGAALLYRTWRKKSMPPEGDYEADKHIFIFFFIVFSTYLIQNLFVFEHPGSYLLIYFSFGLLLSLIAGKNKSVEPKYNFTYSSFFVIFCLLLVVFFVIFFNTSVKTYRAAIGIIRAESIFVKNYRAGVEEYKNILAMKTPFIDEMRSSMVKRALQVNDNIMQTEPDYKNAVMLAREQMLKQIEEENSKDVYDYILLGQVDTMLGMADARYLDSAEDMFSRARELSPKRQQIYYTWARTKFMKHDTEGAIELIEQAMEFEPAVADSYWYLALIYNQIGEKELSWEYAEKALDRNYSWKSMNEVYFAIDLAEMFKGYKRLPQLYSSAIYFSPSSDLYVRLGQAHARLGEMEKAADAFKKAREMNPDLFKQQE